MEIVKLAQRNQEKMLSSVQNKSQNEKVKTETKAKSEIKLSKTVNNQKNRRRYVFVLISSIVFGRM